MLISSAMNLDVRIGQLGACSESNGVRLLSNDTFQPGGNFRELALEQVSDRYPSVTRFDNRKTSRYTLDEWLLPSLFQVSELSQLI